jgi:hypothetical protein
METLFELQLSNLSDFVTLIHAPLTRLQIDGVDYNWYDISTFETSELIDLFLVDGPPGMTQKLARYPAIQVIKKYSSKSATVILDDAYRNDEKEIVQLWQMQLPNSKLEFLNISKGIAVLKF